MSRKTNVIAQIHWDDIVGIGYTIEWNTYNTYI